MIRQAACLVCLSASLLIAAGCKTEPPRRSLFHFDRPDISPHDVVASDAPSFGKDASYKVPARRALITTESRYTNVNSVVHDPVYGPHHVNTGIYEEIPYTSPYYEERSGDPILPDGDKGLILDLQASHTMVPTDGGTVWARVNITAPNYVAPRKTGMNLALVLDLSESMKDPEKMQLMKTVAKNLVAQLLPNDRIALVGFGKKVYVLQPTQEATARQAALSTIDELVAEGGDNMGAGVYEAYLQVEKGYEKGGQHGHVILLSDGLLEVGGGWRVEDLARQKHARGMRLSTVGLGSHVNARLLVSLARAGEGRFAYLHEDANVGDVIAKEMRSMLRTYAKNVRLRLESNGVRVLNALGSGIQNARPGARELVLADFATGEERSFLVRLRVPPFGAKPLQEVEFKLHYAQENPVRRMILPSTISIRGGKAMAGEDKVIRIHARLAAGLDLIRKALETQNDAFATSAIDMLENEYPTWKATVLAEGDRALEKQAFLFEELADRLRTLLKQGKFRGASPERERLRGEMFARYG